MAGNNAIQFLRGTTSAISSSTATLLEGQPLYDYETGLFYVGKKGGGQLIRQLP